MKMMGDETGPFVFHSDARHRMNREAERMRRQGAEALEVACAGSLRGKLEGGGGDASGRLSRR